MTALLCYVRAVDPVEFPGYGTFPAVKVCLAKQHLADLGFKPKDRAAALRHTTDKNLPHNKPPMAEEPPLVYRKPDIHDWWLVATKAGMHPGPKALKGGCLTALATSIAAWIRRLHCLGDLHACRVDDSRITAAALLDWLGQGEAGRGPGAQAAGA